MVEYKLIVFKCTQNKVYAFSSLLKKYNKYLANIEDKLWTNRKSYGIQLSRTHNRWASQLETTHTEDFKQNS